MRRSRFRSSKAKMARSIALASLHRGARGLPLPEATLQGPEIDVLQIRLGSLEARVRALGAEDADQRLPREEPRGYDLDPAFVLGQLGFVDRPLPDLPS